MEDKTCIGGFTASCINTKRKGWVKEKDTVLFNLSLERFFPCQNEEKAIYVNSNFGPKFGFDELCVLYEPFNGHENCRSLTNNSAGAFKIPIDTNGINMLTNTADDDFSIIEIEVWEVSGAFIKYR